MRRIWSAATCRRFRQGYEFELSSEGLIAPNPKRRQAAALQNRSALFGSLASKLGLKKFEREFAYMPGRGFTVTDEVETTKPSNLTLLLHADDRIQKVGDDRFSIDVRGVTLLIDPTIEEPNELRLFRTAIETNTITAPGPPGAVDKGERQARGQELSLSTPAPVTRARFVERLVIQ